MIIIDEVTIWINNYYKIVPLPKDYFIHSSEARKEMVLQVGNTTFDRHGIMNKGVIVRHLTLLGYLQDSKNIIKYL